MENVVQGVHRWHSGLVPLALLEAGDGVDLGGAAEQRQDHIGQRHIVSVTLILLPLALILSGPKREGQFAEDMVPTVGFNMKKVTRGNVTIKLWDIGGQPRFRSMWERCK